MNMGCPAKRVGTGPGNHDRRRQRRAADDGQKKIETLPIFWLTVKRTDAILPVLDVTDEDFKHRSKTMGATYEIRTGSEVKEVHGYYSEIVKAILADPTPYETTISTNGRVVARIYDGQVIEG